MEATDLTQVRTLFKGKKYNWQAKANFHIHLIEHIHFDIIEVVAFNTGNFQEAPHVFVPRSVVNAKVVVSVSPVVVSEVRHEFALLGIEPPTLEEIEDVVRRNEISAFILDRISVSLYPTFTIDVRDFENTYRVQAGNRPDGSDGDAQHDARRGSVSQWSKDVLSGALTGVANAHYNALDEIEPETFSLLHLKPEAVDPAVIKRFGKSTTLVGEVMRDERVSKYAKLLHDFVAQYTSPDAQKLSKDTAQRISQLHKKHKDRSLARKVNTAFHKFKHDEDLLQASLAYIHVSEYIQLQIVCRLWHRVLFAALRGMAHMHISSRDSYLCELSCLQPLGNKRVGYTLRRPASSASAPISEQGDAAPEPTLGTPSSEVHVSPQARLQWRSVFVLPQTVESALGSTAVRLHTLQLHYVVLDSQLLTALGRLNGALRHLSLGIIKVDEDVADEPPLAAGAQEVADSHSEGVPSLDRVPRPPPLSSRPSHANPGEDGALPSSQTDSPHSGRPVNSMVVSTGRGILNRRRLQMQAAAALVQEQQPSPPRPSRPVAQLRYMDAHDVARVLRACGSHLTHLELSVTIGPIPPEVFQHTPRLQCLTALHTMCSPAVPCKPRDGLSGAVALEDLQRALAGITAPSLLCLVSDSPQEALALTDRTGHFCVVSAAFERITGRGATSLCGAALHVLTGPLTDTRELRKIEECLALQYEAVSCTTHLHRPDGQAFLTQISVLPNVLVHHGLPLDQDCISLDHLEQLALQLSVDQSGTSAAGSDASSRVMSAASASAAAKDAKFLRHSDDVHEFIQGMREHHYHLVRLGAMSQPFRVVSAGMM